MTIEPVGRIKFTIKFKDDKPKSDSESVEFNIPLKPGKSKVSYKKNVNTNDIDWKSDDASDMKEVIINLYEDIESITDEYHNVYICQISDIKIVSI
jgi:hypothetical protein